MSEKILLVDDDFNLLDSFQRRLKEEFVVSTSLNGQEGLETIKVAGPFAVIISDLRMPGMDGVQFLSRVRELAPDSVRMLLTGHADLQTAIEAVNRGNIFRLLTKPCPPDSLRAALAAGVNQYRLVINERERVRKEKASLTEQLFQAQKMEALGRLAGGIAHDFNNFLTIINTTSQLALMDAEGDARWRENFKSIQKAGEGAANLTRQLLAFSRREALEVKIFDLNHLLRELAKILHRIIGEDIEIKMRLDKNLGWMKADPGQIEQVILNLVVNARDAMPSGGEIILETANTELDQPYGWDHTGVVPGSYVMLAVSDTGTGMTREVQKRIFEPFFTTKEKGKGTGLGLSIVDGIVRQSDGRIGVYSQPGQGTTFKICFPRVESPRQESKKKIEATGLPSGGGTILLVEDEEEVRKLAGAILRQHGFRVLEAAHGGDALQVIGHHPEPIQLLLTDVVMPEMNGSELACRLKYVFPKMKVLYMSGYADSGILPEGVSENGNSFLPKPFSLEGLIGKVRGILQEA